MLVCLISLTCSVNWEIKVAWDAMVGESFWCLAFLPLPAVFRADFLVFLVLSLYLIVNTVSSSDSSSGCTHLRLVRPDLGEVSLLPSIGHHCLPLLLLTSCCLCFLRTLPWDPNRHWLLVCELLVWTTWQYTLSFCCQLQISIGDMGAFLQSLLLPVLLLTSIPLVYGIFLSNGSQWCGIRQICCWLGVAVTSWQCEDSSGDGDCNGQVVQSPMSWCMSISPCSMCSGEHVSILHLFAPLYLELSQFLVRVASKL